MVRVTVLSQSGRTVGFICEDHADCGDYGEDIVCAAISAVTQTALLGITDIVKSQAGIVRKNGYCSCNIQGETSEEKQAQGALVLDTMLCGLRSIREAYPKALKFSHREV